MTMLDYQTRAERHNRRTAKRFPLFASAGVLAEVVKPWTAESVERMVDDYQDAVTQTRRAGYRRGAELRAQAAELATPEFIHALDRAFARTYPHKPEYWCDYWAKHLRILTSLRDEGREG